MKDADRTEAAAPELPDGFRIRLRDDLILADKGQLLVGGSPVRAVRLSPQARRLLADGSLTVTGQATAALARRLLEGNLADPVLDGIEVPRSDLTVVVPVRDRIEQLDRCLAELESLQVVVVDDASRNSAAVAQAAHRHGALLVELHRNLGPAGARNAGLARVHTPLVAFVDSDVQVDACALLALARHCTDPRVALVGPLVAGSPQRQRPRWHERYDAAASSLDLGTIGGQIRSGAAVGWLPSACLVGQVALLRGGIGGFQEGWRVAEDVDLVWRLVNAGHVVRYDPSVRARHDVRPTVRGWLGRKFVYGTGGADLAARHGDKVAPAVLPLPMAVAAAAVLQRRWWSAPCAAIVVAATARAISRRLPPRAGNTVVAVRLAGRGLGWAIRQESALLLRHWWPATLAAAPRSRSVRRALLTAVVIDLAAFYRERTGVGPATALAARRLDDLAYGAGLWWGALRLRDIRCLLPRTAVAVQRPAASTTSTLFNAGG